MTRLARRERAQLLVEADQRGLLQAFLANDALMQVFRPGDHGSTFGGNPLASAVADEALRLLADERLAERAARLDAACRPWCGRPTRCAARAGTSSFCCCQP